MKSSLKTKEIGLSLLVGILSVVILIFIVIGLATLAAKAGLNLRQAKLLANLGVFFYGSVILLVWLQQEKLRQHPLIGNIVKYYFGPFSVFSEFRFVKCLYLFLLWLSLGGYILDNLWFLSEDSMQRNAQWQEQYFRMPIVSFLLALGVLRSFLVFLIGLKRFYISIICFVLWGLELFLGREIPSYILGPFTTFFAELATLVFGYLLFKSFEVKYKWQAS